MKKKNWHSRDERSCGKCGVVLKNDYEKRFDREIKRMVQKKVKFCPNCGWGFEE